MLAIDDSHSMRNHGAGRIALEAMIVLCKATAAGASKAAPLSGPEIAHIGVRAPLPSVRAAPCDYDTMLLDVAEHGSASAQRADWFDWAHDAFKALRKERKERLSNRVYRMKNNQHIMRERMPLKQEDADAERVLARVVKAEARGQMQQHSAKEQAMRASPLQHHQMQQQGGKPRSSPALASRLRMPIQQALPVARPS